MNCDWANKTLVFSEGDRQIKLQGLQHKPLELHSILATKVFNLVKGNDVWAFVLMDYVPGAIVSHPDTAASQPQAITKLLESYQDVFNDLK